MRIFRFFWKKLAELRLRCRLMLKMTLFVGVVCVVLFPNPKLFFRQLYNYFHLESLIQSNFQGIDDINRAIDALLPPKATRKNEFNVIQRYVYQQIRYEYDWKNWGNFDFWPTAEQVWQRQKEDCDGRAVLAASILRSRGFATAQLVGNIRHIWVVVGPDELMEPDQEQTFKVEGGAPTFALPSLNLMLNGMALYIADFPGIRNLIIFFTLMVLCYHPCRDVTRFFGLTTLGLVGFIVLKDWAKEVRINDLAQINVELISGGACIGLAVLRSIFINVHRET